jgi:hypothetical protein
MFERGSIIVSVVWALLSTIVAASAFDETKYPDLRGVAAQPNANRKACAKGRQRLDRQDLDRHKAR